MQSSRSADSMRSGEKRSRLKQPDVGSQRWRLHAIVNLARAIPEHGDLAAVGMPQCR
jgi:hypothetical protein